MLTSLSHYFWVVLAVIGSSCLMAKPCLNFRSIAVEQVKGTDLQIENANPEDEFIKINVDDFNTSIHIYFPSDGHQPSTRDAALFSQANKKDPRITKWYMRMFGHEGIYNLGRHQSILEDQSTNPLIQFEESDNEFTSNFWKNFEEVASNAAGRLLLYRILIEVCREEASVGIEEPRDGIDNCRWKELRLLNIVNADTVTTNPTNLKYWGYDSSGSYPEISCCFKKERLHQLTLVFPDQGGGYQTLRPESNDGHSEEPTTLMKVALFHELLHWYQQLRDNNRVTAESNCLLSDALNNSFVQMYYKDCDKKAIPLLSWGMSSLIDVNELRVICGTPREYPNYLEGDDLSENVFRIFDSTHLRFGHGDPVEPTFLDQDAVILALSTAKTCAQQIDPDVKLPDVLSDIR